MLLQGISRNNWQNRLIFPSLVVAFGMLAFTEKNIFCWGIAFYFLIQMGCRKWWGLVALTLACSFFGFFRVHQQDQFYEKIPWQKETQINLQLTMVGDSLKIKENQISFDGLTANKGKVKVFLFEKSVAKLKNWQSQRDKTSLVEVNGTFSRGKPRKNLSGFDYQNYLKNHGYLGIINGKRAKIISSSKKMTFSLMRGRILVHIEKHFPLLTASFMKALFLGYKDQEFQLVTEGLKQTGLLHLFSISGMHFIFFFGLVDKFFRRLKMTAKEAYLPFILCLFIGLQLFGGSPSVLRACLLYGVKRTLKLFKLHFSSMDCFSLVLILMLLIWPRILLTTGGQLTLYFSGFILFLPKVRDVKDKFRQSLYFSFLPAPLMMGLFSEWSFLGGVLTFLCLPFFSYFLLPILLLFLGGSMLLGQLPHSLLVLLEFLLKNFAFLLNKINFALLITGKPTWWLTFFCLLIGLWLMQKQAKLRWLVLLCFLLPLAQGRMPVNGVVAFVDVGQGDSIVLQSPFNRQVLLIDTGGKLDFQNKTATEKIAGNSNAATTLIPFLKSRGIAKIHQLVLTHGDQDHLGDALEICQIFQVGEVIIPAGSQSHPKILSLLKQLPKGTSWKTVQKGVIINQAFYAEVLAPSIAGKGENADSIVLTTRISQRRFLFTGDLEQAGEKQLLQHYPQLRVDILKVGHHGSKTSTAESFLSELQPKDGVISCGEQNNFGHPHQEVLENLQRSNTKIWRTDLQGMVYFEYGPLIQKKPPQLKAVISQ